ncbi:Acyl dehydratase [Mesorhizobium albiziae]|uniref:Acyl dehydratase n=1 Tax=Neomesorhizobium albiziae TaxID=335020 RepID=A0A1I3V1G4_9HYPH|nr:MaoC family dehydratase [Mesorhizobium albiziae]GLS28599.1 enoyl-CoA hydratase [Mesorhizobium albiziae]SFJ88980.1 Acyl dehydratase [Mesorhizobium albiziae]
MADALTFETMGGMAGKELGVSGWVTVDQEMINQFAECTRDRQWIHIDVERAKRESPFKAPVAHGYLTLSLIAAMSYELGALPKGTAAAFNYGLDKVRFLAPVRVGSRVRLRSTLMSFDDKGGGQYLMKSNNVIEIDGEDKPALIAETLAMLVKGK